MSLVTFRCVGIALKYLYFKQLTEELCVCVFFFADFSMLCTGHFLFVSLFLLWKFSVQSYGVEISLVSQKTKWGLAAP